MEHVLDEAEAYIERLKASSNDTTQTSPSSHALPTPAHLDGHNALPVAVDVSTVVEEEMTDSINCGNGLDSSRDPVQYSPERESRRPSQQLTDDQTPGRDLGLSLFPMDDYMNIETPNLSFYSQNGFIPQRGLDEETGAAILDPVTTFSSAIFRTQAETSVMASVVADYIAWLRKAPPGGGIPTEAESPVYLGMLDNLEVRLRELCEMSQSRSAAALKELVEALVAIAPPGGAMAARLGSLEVDLQKEAQERAEVFRSRYNPCALLSQQPRNTADRSH